MPIAHNHEIRVVLIQVLAHDYNAREIQNADVLGQKLKNHMDIINRRDVARPIIKQSIIVDHHANVDAIAGSSNETASPPYWSPQKYNVWLFLLSKLSGQMDRWFQRYRLVSCQIIIQY